MKKWKKYGDVNFLEHGGFLLQKENEKTFNFFFLSPNIPDMELNNKTDYACFGIFDFNRKKLLNDLIKTGNKNDNYDIMSDEELIIEYLSTSGEQNPYTLGIRTYHTEYPFGMADYMHTKKEIKTWLKDLNVPTNLF